MQSVPTRDRRTRPMSHGCPRFVRVMSVSAIFLKNQTKFLTKIIANFWKCSVMFFSTKSQWKRSDNFQSSICREANDWFLWSDLRFPAYHAEYLERFQAKQFRILGFPQAGHDSAKKTQMAVFVLKIPIQLKWWSKTWTKTWIKNWTRSQNEDQKINIPKVL